MTPAAISSIGRALYGENWQTQLAHALGIGARHMRHMLHTDPAKRRAPPGDLGLRLAKLCAERVELIQGEARKLKL